MWLVLVDRVSEVTRMPWDQVWNLNIYEFFNYYAYVKDKSEQMKRELDKIKGRHTKNY